MYPSFLNLYDNLMSMSSDISERIPTDSVHSIEKFSYFSKPYFSSKHEISSQKSESNPKNVALFRQVLMDHHKYPEDIYHFEAYGFKCFIRTIHHFNWSGYVLLPENHIDSTLTSVDLNKIYNVLNGISYCNYGYIGFSTISEDSYCLLREIISGVPEKSSDYHTFEFVKSETEYLARQVAYRHQYSLVLSKSETFHS